MDFSGNSELQQIFREEVDERATSLVDGACVMQERELSPPEVVDRRRDAHTIKGNALVMGYPHMAEAAKLLEDLLRDVEGGQRSQTAELGRLIESVALQFLPTVDTELDGTPLLLNKAADRLRIHLGLAPLDPEPDGGLTAEPTEVGTPEPALQQEAETSGFDNVVKLPGEPSQIPIEEPANLGGLVEALESQLVGEVTRVESAKLYRLINRIVELRLDADSVLRGLSGVAPAPDPAVRPASDDDQWEVALRRLDQTARSLEADALDLASAALVDVTRTFTQLVNFLGRRTGKDVRLEVIGDEIEVDRQIVDALREPLRHLVVNAVDHGIELPDERSAAGKPTTGTLLLRASINDNLLTITVADDGRGIDWDVVREVAGDRERLTQEIELTEVELSRYLFSKAFSTVKTPGDISGDGSGLAAVAELVQGLNGSMSLETSPAGTAVSMTLPRSLALQHVLVVDVSGQRWGIPETSVLKTTATDGPIREIEYEGMMIPVTPLAAAVGVSDDSTPGAVVVVSTRTGAMGFSVGSVVGSRRVAVKALGPLLTGAPHLSGAAFLGGGEVVVVVAPEELAERAHSLPQGPVERSHVLVVDDSRGVRQLVEATLSSEGFRVSAAENAVEALDTLASGRFDALIVDYRMPGSDGVEVVAEVRRMFPAMPIVMVSAVAGVDDQTRAYAAGVDAYLDKSDFRRGALAATLRSLLAAAGSRDEVAR